LIELHIKSQLIFSFAKIKVAEWVKIDDEAVGEFLVVA
jgi:hypothetical protein